MTHSYEVINTYNAGNKAVARGPQCDIMTLRMFQAHPLAVHAAKRVRLFKSPGKLRHVTR